LVSSAKSWLCHGQVNRQAPILPWGTKPPARLVSPVEASARYLAHLKESWNHLFAVGREEARLERQQVVITIPASFDEAARELTCEAARLAGIESFTMLEEPQAAFYSWLAAHEHDWREILPPGSLILVMDIGGGTTDFNLIMVRQREGQLGLERVAVGDHLMLGGDNMDLALARRIETKATGGRRLDIQRWLSLAFQCRIAKEELLAPAAPESVAVNILGRGKGVVSGTIGVEVTRKEVEETVVSGFFSQVAITDRAEKGPVAALQELGLPYVADPLIPHHLAAFLERHSSNPLLADAAVRRNGRRFVAPDVVLLNGAVFKAAILRELIFDLLREWFEGEPGWQLRVLENRRLDEAVSFGAAYYGGVQRGRGVRISGGLGRAYYLGLDRSDDEVTAVCVAPRELDEGEEIMIEQQGLEVLTNRPVSFPLYSSSYRVGDRAGDIVTVPKGLLAELPPVETVLLFGKKSGTVRIPVSIGARLTEFGTLDVWCASQATPHRWQLVFQLRREEAGGGRGPAERYIVDSETLEEAATMIERSFRGSPELPPAQLLKKLTALFQLDRSSWPLGTIRALGERLLKLEEVRGVTPELEERWLNLSGFLLRPGFGHPLDEWRSKEIWKIYPGGLRHGRKPQCRIQWWIFWRRVAGGLTRGQQEQIFHTIGQWLIPGRKKKGPKPSSAEIEEMWMLAASLEQLPAEVKAELGEAALAAIVREKGVAHQRYWWIVSRLGARTPFHGPVDCVIPRQQVERWIRQILALRWPTPKETVFALTQLARRTGDRARDIDDELRAALVDKFSSFKWAKHSIRQLHEPTMLDETEESKVFGEALPVGLLQVEE